MGVNVCNNLSQSSLSECMLLCSSKAKSDEDVEHAGICQVMNWCIKSSPCQFGTDINIISIYSCFSLLSTKDLEMTPGQKLDV